MSINTKKRLRFLRGNTAAVSTFVGFSGEFTVNTDNWSVSVHDGVTPGGILIGGDATPTNVSAFINDAGYITINDVPVIPTIVSAFTNDALYITSADIPTNVSTFTNDAAYITLADVPAIPTAVSAFTNDAGYLTTLSGNVSSFTNDAGYITINDVPASTPTTAVAATSAGIEEQAIALISPFSRNLNGSYTYDHQLADYIIPYQGSQLFSYDDYSGNFRLRKRGTYRIRVDYKINQESGGVMYPVKMFYGATISTGESGMTTISINYDQQDQVPGGENGDPFSTDSPSSVSGSIEAIIATGTGPNFQAGYNFLFGLRAGAYGFEFDFYNMSATLTVTRIGDEPNNSNLLVESFDGDSTNRLPDYISIDRRSRAYPYYPFLHGIETINVIGGAAYLTNGRYELGATLDALLDYDIADGANPDYGCEIVINVPASVLTGVNDTSFSMYARVQNPLSGASTVSGANGQNFLQAVLNSDGSWAFPGPDAISQGVVDTASGSIALTAGDHTLTIEVFGTEAYFYIDGDYLSTSSYLGDGAGSWASAGRVGFGITKSSGLDSIQVKSLRIFTF